MINFRTACMLLLLSSAAACDTTTSEKQSTKKDETTQVHRDSQTTQPTTVPETPPSADFPSEECATISTSIAANKTLTSLNEAAIVQAYFPNSVKHNNYYYGLCNGKNFTEDMTITHDYGYMASVSSIDTLDEDKYLAVIQSNYYDHECHSCGALIGTSLIKKSASGYSIIDTDNVGEYGTWGFAPSMKVVKGGSSFGLLLEPGFSGQGYTLGSLELFWYIDNSFVPVLSIEETYKDNAGTGEDTPKFKLDVQAVFTDKLVNGLPVLELRRFGTDKNEDEEIFEVDEVQVYEYNGSKYTLVK